jgi:hypothetical protein
MMMGSADEDAVTRWQNLTLRWEAASQHHERVLAKIRQPQEAAESAKLAAEEEHARAELAAIKKEMNDLIAKTAAGRTVNADHLVVGVIELPSEKSANDDTDMPVPLTKVANS